MTLFVEKFIAQRTLVATLRTHKFLIAATLEMLNAGAHGLVRATALAWGSESSTAAHRAIPHHHTNQVRDKHASDCRFDSLLG